MNNFLLKLLLLGGLVAGVIALTTDVRRAGSLTSSIAASLTRSDTASSTVSSTASSARSQPSDCQGEVHQGSLISRGQLASFLTISERDARTKVEDVLQTPYCHLSNLEVRAGVQAERAVYPLAFDPQTWLVVLYEGDEYAGYQFRFQQ